MCTFNLPTGIKRIRLRIPTFVGHPIAMCYLASHTQHRLQAGNCKNLNHLHLISVPVGLGVPVCSV